MDYCEEKKYQNEIYKKYITMIELEKYINMYIESFDDINKYENNIKFIYSKNSKL